MSTLNMAFAARGSETGYLKNLGQAVIALLGALLAVAPRKAEKNNAGDRSTLYRMANQYEASMPNLATELRFLASRG